ncbi:peptidase M48 [Hymenobacter psoromatis]|nr:peptidase M48 [Hymenobacter psoromatis]
MPAFFSRVLRPAALLLLLPLASATPTKLYQPAARVAAPLQGAQPDPQVIAQFGLYNNPKLQAYITQQGKRMTAISDRPGDYGFTIVDSPVINAFATPDGHVYFTRGIMAYFNDEAQFTGVLGHELGHITAQHGKKQQRNSILSSILVGVATMASPNLLGRIAQPAAQLVSLKYSRGDENEADGLGVKYSTKVGYDASHMANFFQTLERTEQQSGGSTPAFLSTHPSSADRYERVKQLAAQAQQSLGKRTLLVNRDGYLRSLEGLPFGDDPRQGFVENSVFYHPDLKFRFPIPAGWKSQNSPEQFQMSEPNGKALLAFMGVGGSSLEEAAQTLAKQIGVTPGTARRTTINGLPALVFEGDQQASQDQQSTPAHVQSYIIQDGKSMFAFVGLATAATFGTYAPQFASAAQGYQRLTEASKLNRQAERVHIKQAKTATTLSAALTANGVPGKRLEEEAILNGMQLTDRLPAGTLFKVIGQ